MSTVKVSNIPLRKLNGQVARQQRVVNALDRDLATVAKAAVIRETAADLATIWRLGHFNVASNWEQQVSRVVVVTHKSAVPESKAEFEARKAQSTAPNRLKQCKGHWTSYAKMLTNRVHKLERRMGAPSNEFGKIIKPVVTADHRCLNALK